MKKIYQWGAQLSYKLSEDSVKWDELSLTLINGRWRSLWRGALRWGTLRLSTLWIHGGWLAGKLGIFKKSWLTHLCHVKGKGYICRLDLKFSWQQRRLENIRNRLNPKMHKLSLTTKNRVYLGFALSDMCYLLPAIDTNKAIKKYIISKNMYILWTFIMFFQNWVQYS